MRLFVYEAWHAFRFGLRGGVVPMVFVVLTGYLLLVLGNADHINQMGAIDIPRNAPGLIYLMTSGDTFFLFFAWAWVFAQVVVRDRSAQLDEVTLALPVRLDVLLAARYVGALGVALVIGCSQIAGFLAVPLLAWVGMIPAASVAAPPWSAFAWANLIFTLPLAAGAGALYTLAAIRTRSMGGPLAVAAALMTCWMVAMVVLKSGHMDPFWATLMDPSGYAEAEHQVLDNWTPQQKATALLAFTPALAWNRLLWCAVPVLVLLWRLRHVQRQQLVLGKEPVQRHGAAPAQLVSAAPRLPLPPIVALHPWRAAGQEALWQVQQVLGQRWLRYALPFLVLLAMAGAYTHVVQHAWGPLVPRMEVVTPLLTDLFRIIFVFMLAGMVGMVARRDGQPGFDDMLDSVPMPPWVRVLGRCAAALACALLLAVVPVLGALGLGWLLAPKGSVQVLPALGYQALVLLPALLEFTLLMLLVHTLVRRAGVAWAASMLVAFVLVVNYEVGLVAYPPYQLGQEVELSLSGLTGLAPWLGQLLLSDAFKLAVCVTLLLLAIVVQPVGCDVDAGTRWRAACRRLRGGTGAALAISLLALAGLDRLLHHHWVKQGEWQPYADTLADDAAWEARWLAEASAIEVDGGKLELQLHPAQQRLTAQWQLHGVRANSGWLHAALPHGLSDVTAQVGGQTVSVEQAADHMALPLGHCATDAIGCTVTLHWHISAQGWRTDGTPPWLGAHGAWLRSTNIVPRLGFDADRVLRTPAERQRLGLSPEVALPSYTASLPSGASAPAGDWRWTVHVPGMDSLHGSTTGLLDFAHAITPALRSSQVGDLTIGHDATRANMSAVIAQDVQAMQACITRRLAPVAVHQVLQWPRGLDDTALAATTLLLAEDPHWDVADQGVGRWARRADIAAALARRYVRDRARLQDGPGAVWLAHGIPGALGLMCVAETDGIPALHALLARGTHTTNEAIASSKVPIARLDSVQSDAWAVDYLPLAALAWTAEQSPQQLVALLNAVRQQRSVTTALQQHLGLEQAQHWLGAPWAVDVRVTAQGIAGERLRWENGGWQPDAGNTIAAQAWRVHDGRLSITPALGAPLTDALVLDDFAGYERKPGDNRLNTVDKAP